jgi:glutaredoxin
MDTLQRFPLVWCPTCEKTQKMIFDVLPAGGKNDHDAADIVCDHCKSIIATLHAPRAQQASARPKRAAKAREMAGQALGRLIDPSASDEDRHTRKRRLLKGPKEFRDIREKRDKPKRLSSARRRLS